jgi:hypothetical protein
MSPHRYQLVGEESKNDNKKQRKCLAIILLLLVASLGIGIAALVLSIHYVPDPLRIHNLEVKETSNLTNVRVSADSKTEGNTMLNTVQVMGDTNLTTVYVSGDSKTEGNTMLNTVQVMGNTNLTTVYVSGDSKTQGNSMLNTVQVMGNTNLTTVYVSGDSKTEGNTMLNTVQVMGDTNLTTVYVGDELVLPECPESVTVGVTAGFPTIKSVFDRYRGRLACPIRVILPAGVYNENVRLEDTSSSLAMAPFARGISLQGDTRFLAGLAFLNGGRHNRPQNAFGGVGNSNSPVTVSLTTGNSFTVSVSGLDLSVHGYGPGDKLYIRDNSFTAYTRNITNITSTTVEFDGPALSDWAVGSYIVFQPNVEIHPVDGNATISVNGGSLAVTGVMLTNPISNSRAQVQVMGGTLAMAQSFIEDRENTCQSIVRISHNGQLTMKEFITPTGNARSVITVAGGFSSIVVDNNGVIEGGSLNHFDSQQFGIACAIANIHLENVQFSDRNLDTKILISFQCKVTVATIISYSTGFSLSNIYVEGAGASFDALFATEGMQFYAEDVYSGIYVGSGASFNTDFTPIQMTNCAYPVTVATGATMGLDAQHTFPSAGSDLIYSTTFSSRFALLNDLSGYGGSNMVYRYTANGDMFPGNAFRYQEIAGEAQVDLTLDLNVFDGYGFSSHDGKTYTVHTASAFNHAITLLNGAVFEGCTVPVNSNKITFDATVGAHVTLFVASMDRVRVISSECVTFSTVPVKRAERDHVMHPYYTGPLGAHYANMTRTTMREMFKNVFI